MYISTDDVFDFLIATSLIFMTFLLGCLNYNLATNICSKADIPFNLSLTMVTPGFGWEITILLTVFEVGLIIYLINVVKEKISTRFCF